VPTEGERIATVETVLQEVREDVQEVKQEAYRARDRLHKVEGSIALLVSHDNVRADIAKERAKKTDRRLQAILALAAIGAIIEPLLSHFVHGG
jgi:hypothetical protein